MSSSSGAAPAAASPPSSPPAAASSCCAGFFGVWVWLAAGRPSVVGMRRLHALIAPAAVLVLQCGSRELRCGIVFLRKSGGVLARRKASQRCLLLQTAPSTHFHLLGLLLFLLAQVQGELLVLDGELCKFLLHRLHLLSGCHGCCLFVVCLCANELCESCYGLLLCAFCAAERKQRRALLLLLIREMVSQIDRLEKDRQNARTQTKTEAAKRTGSCSSAAANY